jgi:PAS domain S-box-containing protein
MGARTPLLGEYGDDFAWSLLDSVPDGVLVATAAGEIVFVNDQLPPLFGGSADEVLSRNVDELLPHELRAAHRAHRDRFHTKPEVRPMGAGLTLRSRRLDGSEFHSEISLAPLRLGTDVFVLVAIRDVSDRIAAEDHLRRVLGTLDASDDGVFMFDAASLRYTHVNDGAVRLVGYSRDELLQMTPLDLNPYDTEEDYRALVAGLLLDPEEHVRREARLRRVDDTDVPVEKTYRAAPAARDGSQWIIASARDITARLETESQLLEQAGALRDAERALIVAEDRDRIARDLHDTVIQRLFGTGLALQSVMTMVDDPARAKLERSIDDIDDTIRELRSAIFSLQSAGSTAAPGGIRHQVVEIVTDIANDAGFQSQLRFEGTVESIDPRVAEQLTPTVREAVSNVAKHAHARLVTVRLVVDDCVTLTVTDDGDGVSDEPGNGHGLENMASRATQLGGHSELRRGEPSGSVFSWTVPSVPTGPGS